MSKNSSIQRLPNEVDPFRLVEQGRIFQGRIPIGDFPRIKELLAEDTGELVEVELEFSRNEQQMPVITGKVNVSLAMICNRCLDTTHTTITSEIDVVLVSSEEQADRLMEGFDTYLIYDQKLVLNDFIEDELLLAMPIVVTHESCEPARKLIEALPEDEQDTEEQQQKENPFAVLKNIKLN